jgi:hypothetical protein
LNVQSAKKWLEDNPVGVGLGIFCGLLVFALVVLLVLSSLPVSSGWIEGEADVSDTELDFPQLAENKPIGDYSIITQRPLFNESRQPSLEGESSGSDGLLLEDDVDAPDVELAGVVITPTLRMVTLKRKDNARSLVAFEGQPIEADFGSWKVSTIQERAATMTSGNGEELQLEMKVHDAEIALPDVPKAKSQPAQTELEAAAVQEGESEQLSRAEEIRQRIAERREELRREAEQSQDDGQAEAEQANYKNVIQSMIGRNRKSQSNDDKEQ